MILSDTRRDGGHLIRMGVSLSCQRSNQAPTMPEPRACYPVRIAFLLDVTEKVFSPMMNYPDAHANRCSYLLS